MKVLEHHLQLHCIVKVIHRLAGGCSCLARGAGVSEPVLVMTVWAAGLLAGWSMTTPGGRQVGTQLAQLPRHRQHPHTRQQ